VFRIGAASTLGLSVNKIKAIARLYVRRDNAMKLKRPPV
jgi:hypothetical protein